MRFFGSLAILAALSSGAIIDRTSIIVAQKPILASDIDRDIRVNAFLNQEKLDFSLAARKKAANRLIDQAIIRGQIRSGGYPIAPREEAVHLFEALKNERFKTDAQYKQALAQYGITDPELLDRLSWQMTVLRFIDARFRPAVVVSEEEISRYYEAHRAGLKTDLEGARDRIVEEISGERVNKLLDDWLEETRKQTRIEYLDRDLQ
jgi:hypothetical protein